MRATRFLVVPNIIAGTDLLRVVPRMPAEVYAAPRQVRFLPLPLRVESFSVSQFRHKRFDGDQGTALMKRAGSHARRGTSLSRMRGQIMAEGEERKLNDATNEKRPRAGIEERHARRPDSASAPGLSAAAAGRRHHPLGIEFELRHLTRRALPIIKLGRLLG